MPVPCRALLALAGATLNLDGARARACVPPNALIDRHGRTLTLQKIVPPARPEIARGAFNQHIEQNTEEK
jgi:hypothetical protein